MVKKYYLTRKDRDGLREMAKKLRAGKVSGRPVPTRRRHVGGSGSGVARGTAIAEIPAGGSGDVTSIAGKSVSDTWTNLSGKDIPSGYICYAANIEGTMEIVSAFCAVEE